MRGPSPIKKRPRDESREDKIDDKKRKLFNEASNSSSTDQQPQQNSEQTQISNGTSGAIHPPSNLVSDCTQSLSSANLTNSQERSPSSTSCIISSVTKKKLLSYSMATESDRSQSVDDFDYRVLKREKALLLPDINVTETFSQKPISLDDLEDEEEKEPSTSKKGDNYNETAASGSKKGGNSQSASTSKTSSFLKQFSSSQSSSTVIKKGKVKYTPLEQQYLDIKEKYPDAVLFVECGYRYRFFGQDAEIAAEVLKIFCHPDHNFMTASIPVHRLFVHIRRIVAAGYKVGVVKQTETAALKAAGDNRSAPFTRQLTALYTKSTLIGEDVDPLTGPEGDGGDLSSSGSTNTFLMCVCDAVQEKSHKGKTIGVVAVQPSTGNVVYDCFEDSNSCSELETRITHIQPVEMIVPEDLSDTSHRLIRGMETISETSDDRLRVEKIDSGPFAYGKAFDTLSDFYKSAKDASRLQEVINLPRPVICCLSGLITYLRDFNLEKVLQETGNFSQFSVKSKFMQLNSKTVRNLELFHNDTDGREKASLFWVLNQTMTRPGARLLRSWLARPLMCPIEIKRRQEAISEIIEEDCPGLMKIKELLSKLPDLERGLCSIYHKKSSTQEFYTVCKCLQQIHMEFRLQKETVGHQLSSRLLQQVVTEVPELLDDVRTFTDAINEKAAKENDKTKLFADESKFPTIKKRKGQISDVLQEITDHRRDVRLTVKQPGLEYVTILGTEFLVEVKNTNLKLVPSAWTKINGTKTVSRFHTPFIVEKYKELNQLREQLTIDSQRAWMEFLEWFGENYQRYRKAVQHVSTLDCLFSLANVAKHHGYCRPEIDEKSSCIEIEQGRHPVIQQLVGEHEQYVPNDTNLSTDGKHVMIITGPNMGGKSSYIKQVALITIMAQMGSFVPANSARIGLFDAVYTRMGAADEIYKGRSTFMVELQEASEIMAQTTSRSLVILDELGRGTSTHDGVAIAQATLNFFIKEPECLTLFVTHYPVLAEFEDLFPDKVGNYHMSFLLNDSNNEDDMEMDANGSTSERTSSSKDAITFLYQLVSGMAARSYGLNVARLASLPENIVQVATEKSHGLEAVVLDRRKQVEAFRDLCLSEEVSVPEILSRLINENA